MSGKKPIVLFLFAMLVVSWIGYAFKGAMPVYPISVSVLVVCCLLSLFFIKPTLNNVVYVTMVGPPSEKDRDPLRTPIAGDLFLRYEPMFGISRFEVVKGPTAHDGTVYGKGYSQGGNALSTRGEMYQTMWPDEWQAWAKQADCIFTAVPLPPDQDDD